MGNGNKKSKTEFQDFVAGTDRCLHPHVPPNPPCIAGAGQEADEERHQSNQSQEKVFTPGDFGPSRVVREKPQASSMELDTTLSLFCQTPQP